MGNFGGFRATLLESNTHPEETIQSHRHGRAGLLSYRMFIALVSVGCQLASLTGANQWTSCWCAF